MKRLKHRSELGESPQQPESQTDEEQRTLKLVLLYLISALGGFLPQTDSRGREERLICASAAAEERPSI